MYLDHVHDTRSLPRVALYIPLSPHGIVHLLRAWVLPVSGVGSGAFGNGGDGALGGEGSGLVSVDRVGGEVWHEVEGVEGTGVGGEAMVVVGFVVHGRREGWGGGLVHGAGGLYGYV